MTVMKIIRGLESYEDKLRELGLLAWRREGFMEILQSLLVPNKRLQESCRQRGEAFHKSM